MSVALELQWERGRGGRATARKASYQLLRDAARRVGHPRGGSGRDGGGWIRSTHDEARQKDGREDENVKTARAMVSSPPH